MDVAYHYCFFLLNLCLFGPTRFCVGNICPEVRDVTVVVGKTAGLYCDIHHLNESSASIQKNISYVSDDGGKILVYQIYKTGGQNVLAEPGIQYTDRAATVYNEMTLVLLHEVTVNDQGVYSCDWKTQPSIPGCNKQEARFKLTVIVPVTHVKAGITSPAIEGGKCHFRCEADGTPPISYTWLISGDRPPDSSDRWHNSDVVIDDIKRGQSGRYRCIANNRAHNRVLSKQVDLEVYYPPAYVEMISSVNNRTLPADTNITLTCSAFGGFPSPEVTIYRNQTEVINSLRSTFIPWPLKMSDNGIPFSCKGTHGGIRGQIKSTQISFNVLYAPVIDGNVVQNRIHSSNDGDTVVFKLHVNSNPIPLYKWTRSIDNKPLPLPSKCEINSSGLMSQLTVPSVSTDDYVNYTCLVENEMGSETFTFLLQPKRFHGIAAIVAGIIGSLAFAASVAVIIKLKRCNKKSNGSVYSNSNNSQMVSTIDDHVMYPLDHLVTSSERNIISGYPDLVSVTHPDRNRNNLLNLNFNFGTDDHIYV